MSSIAWDTWIPHVTLKTKLSTTWLLLFPGCRGIPALLSHTRRGERVILLSWHWFVWAPCLRVIGCLTPPGQSESSYPNIQIQKQWTLRLSHLFNLSASTRIILWQPSFHVLLTHNRVCVPLTEVHVASHPQASWWALVHRLSLLPAFVFRNHKRAACPEKPGKKVLSFRGWRRLWTFSKRFLHKEAFLHSKPLSSTQREDVFGISLKRALSCIYFPFLWL